MIFTTKNYPVVFLSYHEENAEHNYERLLQIVPNALRVDGVTGSDTAHKEIAKLFTDETHVIVVDGDNYITDDFLSQTIDFIDNVDFFQVVISFSGYNVVNGNMYGNGGVKVWPIELLRNMQTHENSLNQDSVDFDLPAYLELNRYISKVYINSSPRQAWRSGFREGMKLCLDKGKIVQSVKDINWRNYERLWRWMHLGANVENGIWAIYGARQAAYIALTKQEFHLANLRDFEHLNNLFEGLYEVFNDNEKALLAECNRLGNAIKNQTADHSIVDVYNAYESANYLDNVKVSKRSQERFIRYKYPGDFDIVFLSDNSDIAQKNYNILINRYPKAKLLQVENIGYNSYVEAAKLCSTDYFWAVPSDAILLDEFNLEFNVPFYEQAKIRAWHSKNIAANKVFEHEGIKLMPRFLTLHANSKPFDIRTSITDHYESVVGLSNYTHKE
jgi:hypothetical protein